MMMCAMPFTVIVSQENITVEAEYIEAVNGMYKYHLYVYTPTSEYALSSIYGENTSEYGSSIKELVYWGFVSKRFI